LILRPLSASRRWSCRVEFHLPGFAWRGCHRVRSRPPEPVILLCDRDRWVGSLMSLPEAVTGPINLGNPRIHPFANLPPHWIESEDHRTAVAGRRSEAAAAHYRTRRKAAMLASCRQPGRHDCLFGCASTRTWQIGYQRQEGSIRYRGLISGMSIKVLAVTTLPVCKKSRSCGTQTAHPGSNEANNLFCFQI